MWCALKILSPAAEEGFERSFRFHQLFDSPNSAAFSIDTRDFKCPFAVVIEDLGAGFEVGLTT